jgi:hypothetical protein
MAETRYTIESIINNIFNGTDLNAVYTTENAINAVYDETYDAININLLSGGLALPFSDYAHFPTVGDSNFLYLDKAQRIVYSYDTVLGYLPIVPKVSDSSASPSADNEGTFMYKKVGNNSYLDFCMKTGAATYQWINIQTISW